MLGVLFALVLKHLDLIRQTSTLHANDASSALNTDQKNLYERRNTETIAVCLNHE